MTDTTDLATAARPRDLRVRSSAPPYSIGDLTFECWIVENGQRYVWETACGYAITREGRHFHAVADRQSIARHCLSLKHAMGVLLVHRAAAGRRRG